MLKQASEIEHLSEQVNELVDTTKDINDLLTLWGEIHNGVTKLNEVKEKIRTKINVYLKERKWDKYISPNKISVAITNVTRKSYDEQYLKQFLTQNELDKCIKVITFEKMQIVTPEIRKNIDKFVRVKK
jgi:hypothetical protein